MLFKAGSLWAIAVALCHINLYATLVQHDSWRLDAVLNRQKLVIVIVFRHYFIMFGIVHCCSQLCNDVWMLRIELFSGHVVLLRGRDEVFCTSVCATKHIIVPQCFFTLIEAC